MNRALVLLLTAVAAALMLPAVAPGQTPGFWLIPYAPDTQGSSVYALSANGSVASGESGDSTFPFRSPGFTWTMDQGRIDFNEPFSSPAFALSADGTVAAGGANQTSGRVPYRRESGGLLQLLNHVGGYTRGNAFGVSGDGAVVVGTSERGPNSMADGQAFRWTAQTGTVGLGYLRPSSIYSEARAISRDGTTIVGSSHQFGPGGPVEAFAWTALTGMRALAQLPSAAVVATRANAVSSDGEFIVGQARDSQGQPRATRWSSSGAVINLGTWADYVSSSAFAVNDDGTVVAGTLSDSPSLPPSAAFVWTEQSGMELLADYLDRNGVNVPAGWQLNRCVALSSDGLTFGGMALGPNDMLLGYVATIPAPSSLAVLAVCGLCISRQGGIDRHTFSCHRPRLGVVGALCVARA